jgi:hypothetical protein
VHSATRLSPVLAYGQLLLLYAASLNAPSASSYEAVGDQPINRRAQTLVRNPRSFERKKIARRFKTNGICLSERHWKPG